MDLYAHNVKAPLMPIFPGNFGSAENAVITAASAGRTA